MAQIMQEARTNEESAVKRYVENNVSQIVIDKINNGYDKDGKRYKKSFGGFMKYACDRARALADKGAQCACIEDNVIYGWAVHYFEEDSITDYAVTDGQEERPARHSASKVVKIDDKKKVKSQKAAISGEQMTLADFGL